MPNRRVTWLPFNHSYGPWYRMLEVQRGLSVPPMADGHSVEAQVQPDMDNSGWYWSVRFAGYKPKIAKEDATPAEKQRAHARKPLPEVKVGGKVPVPGPQGRAEAMRLAEAAFRAGRPKGE